MSAENLTALTLGELLTYNEVETERWREWFEKQPSKVLDLPIDIANLGSVRGLLRHIFWVELRYVERILQFTPETPFEAVTAYSVDELFAFALQTRAKFRDFLSIANAAQLKGTIEFHTITAGLVRATRRKVFVHAMLHGVRHWAQLATALRQAGYATDWPHDFLYRPVID